MVASTFAVTTEQTLEEELAAFPLERAPRSTTLSAHELYLLEQAGYEVLQVVTGNIVYSMGLRGLVKTVKRAFGRGEMKEFTRMNQDARNLARNRLLAQASEVGADLVVGITFHDNEFADFLEIMAIGTAVKRVREPGARDGLPIAVGS